MTKGTQYFEAVGRRKTSVARVRITEATKTSFVINDKEFNVHFPTKELQAKATEPLKKTGICFSISIKSNGGGISSQAGAVSLGIARCLIKFDLQLRGVLKADGFLKRDPRAKERRKFGLKKARKAPQWSKR